MSRSAYDSTRSAEDDRYDEAELLAHAQQIFTPVKLPCGRVVPNRLVKVCGQSCFGDGNFAASIGLQALKCDTFCVHRWCSRID